MRIRQNKLATLPESFARLSDLSNWVFGQNQLTALPEHFGQLAALQHVGLIVKQIVALPESVGQLASLLSLGLQQNQLTTLPDSVGHLAALQAYTSACSCYSKQVELCSGTVRVWISSRKDGRSDYDEQGAGGTNVVIRELILGGGEPRNSKCRLSVGGRL